MPWAWNDKNFMDREIKAGKSTLKVGTPLFILSLIVWKFVSNITTIEYFILVVITTGWSISIISLIYKIPNSYIDEERDSELTQKRTRWIQFFLANLILYYVVIGILYQYYPFLEKFICCNLVRNMHLFLK